MQDLDKDKDGMISWEEFTGPKGDRPLYTKEGKYIKDKEWAAITGGAKKDDEPKKDDKAKSDDEFPDVDSKSDHDEL